MAKSKKTDPGTKAAIVPKAEATPYTVVARRYRPQQFGDLIGQEHVASALFNAIQSGRIAHAYLFTGSRGVGKTSAARILAKSLNCESGITTTPCDKCASCLAIAAGDDIDVLEIDGASNRRIEEIREIRQGVGFRPTRSRFKIYIIDEVHMLTKEAFNALLKTLEEPPEHVKFIFATTEVEKIPITILSRCQRFDFANVGPGKIFEQLKTIVEREGHEADEAALRLIARRAAGSMRDSQSLLDQLLASSKEKLTAEHVAAVLGTAGEERVIQLVDAIVAGEATTALNLISDWVEQGLQIGELLDELIEYWRSLMLVSCGGPEIRALPVSTNQHEALSRHTAALPLDAILAGLDVLSATKMRLRGSTHTQVLLEMAIVRLARLNELLQVGRLIEMIERPEAAAAGIGQKPRNAHVAQERAKKNAGMTNPTEVLNSTDSAQPRGFTEAELPEIWGQLLQYCEETYPILGNHLKVVNSYAIFGPNSLAIRFPSAYNLQHDACASETSVSRIQAVLKRITGLTIMVRVELDRAIDESRAATGDGQTTKEPPPSDKKKSLMTLPLFKKASEALGAQLWHLDDDFDAGSQGRDHIPS